MFKYFPGIGSKGKDVQGLIQNSVKLLGRDKDVFKPALFITAFKSIPTIIIFFMLYQVFVVKDYNKLPIIILSLFVIAPIISFINMRYKAITCSMVYDILRGKDTDIAFASRRVKGRSLTIFLYSIIDLVIKNAGNSKKKSGLMSIIMDLILAAFKEVWDLIKNFSLPAIVIDEAKVSSIPSHLKKIKKNIPAALVGILGLDLIGGVLVSLLGVIQLPALLISGAIGFYGVSFLPEAWTYIHPENTNIIINFLPFFIFLFISTVMTSFFNTLVQLVKTSYFTTFYVSLTHPASILDELKEDVTNYLNFNKRVEGYTFFKKEEEAYDFDTETNEDIKLLRKLANTFKKNMDKGLSKEKITKALLKKGYSQAIINKSLELLDSSK